MRPILPGNETILVKHPGRLEIENNEISRFQLPSNTAQCYRQEGIAAQGNILAADSESTVMAG